MRVTMRHRIGPLAVALLAAATAPLTAQSAERGPPAVADTGFAALQARCRTAMGVDQYASAHRFDDLPDGGRIELQSSTDDTVAAQAIRGHLRHIAEAFAAGDFRIPGFVHDGTVPGTAAMAAEGRHITYRFSTLPRGGEVRIATASPTALRAVHSFLAFQRDQHRASGTELHH